MRNIDWRQAWRIAWAYYYAEISVAIAFLLVGLAFLTGVF